MRRLSFIILILVSLISSCRQNSSQKADTAADTDKKRVDWTGTYELKDKDLTYTLKLHKRSVDGSYEMQFYNDGKNAALYKSSIYDAKDDSMSICIRFLNNFQTDAAALGFKSGDTLFILASESDSVKCSFRAFRPALAAGEWKKVSGTY